MTWLERRDSWVSLGIFLVFFALYTFTAGPWVVPYRDSGEMSVLLKTLSVAHPPGYPLYTLLGKLFVTLPFGSTAYRTNLFSALFGAAGLTVFYFVLRRIIGMVPSLAAVAFLGFSFPYWELSVVSEMYSLGAFWLGLILLTLIEPDLRNLFPYVYSLGLGVRMDFLLLMPVFLIWLYFERVRPSVKSASLAFLMGLTIFLYLPIRSRTDPVIDWGNPDTLTTLLASMTRKSYSGTLDLLSLSYKKGENFGSLIFHYLRHLQGGFGVWGILAALLGIFWFSKNHMRFGLLIGSLFLFSGPLFLFLANMPPNPHSLAIVEASYLLPDILLAISVGAGIHYLFEKISVKMIVVPLMAGFIFLNAAHGFHRCSKRENFYARDYATNIFRSLPRGSVAVFHKDVQLFTLWYEQLAEGKRRDVSLVATGLSGSPWYWDMVKRWGTASSPEISLKEARGWKETKDSMGERPFFAGCDVEMPPLENLPISGRGALCLLGTYTPQDQAVGSSLLEDLSVYRGVWRYEHTPDFFSSDLIGDLARAHDQQAVTLLLQPDTERQKVDRPKAEWLLRRCENMDPTFPRASNDLGYIYYMEGDAMKSAGAYSQAAQKNLDLLGKTKIYKSLPEVAQGIKADLSGTYVSWGGALEKMGRKNDSRELYEAALAMAPSAQAHYNLAVTYWNEDWPRVVQHLEQALRLNPQMSEARKYYAAALSNLNSSPRRKPGSRF